jgi:excisionase family DNA binding protein
MPGRVEEREFLTAKQAGQRLGVSDKMAYRLFHERKLRGLKVEGAVRIYAASVEEYIRTHTNSRVETPALPEPKKGRCRDDFTNFYLRVMEEIQNKQRAG